MTKHDGEKSKLNWTELGGHSSSDLKSLVSLILLSILIFALIGAAMVKEWIIPGIAAGMAAIWTLAIFHFHIRSHRRMVTTDLDRDESAAATDHVVVPMLADDRFWASLLCAAAVFMHYYYY